VHKLQPARVQRLAPERAQSIAKGRTRARGKLQASTVNRIPQERITAMRHVHADLVGAPRFQVNIKRRAGTQALGDAVVRDGRLTAGRHHGHARALLRVPPDRGVHTTATARCPAHDRVVLPRDLFTLQLHYEGGMGRERCCNDQQPGGVFIEAMHQATSR